MLDLITPRTALHQFVANHRKDVATFAAAMIFRQLRHEHLVETRLPRTAGKFPDKIIRAVARLPET